MPFGIVPFQVGVMTPEEWDELEGEGAAALTFAEETARGWIGGDMLTVGVV